MQHLFTCRLLWLTAHQPLVRLTMAALVLVSGDYNLSLVQH